MDVPEARNGGISKLTSRAEQEKQIPENSDCKPQLFVTFSRKTALPSMKDHADGYSTSLVKEPENSSFETQGHSNPTQDAAKIDSLSLTSKFSLNEEQQGIIRDFEAIMTSIGGIIASDAHSQGERNSTLHPAPSLRPVAYSPNIFQSYYECHFPSRSTPITPQTYNLKALRTHPSILTFETKHNLEVILDIFTPSPSPSPPTPPSTSRPIKLALFDMDSTLIQEEVIDELARTINAYDAVSAITTRAMADPTFDFAASLRARVALLKGVPSDVWVSLQQQEKIQIAPGARELIQGLKARGCVTGVISGGFMPMAEWLRVELGLDLAFANYLAVEPANEEFAFEHLTGELDLSDGKVIVTPEYKRDTLIKEAGKRGIEMQFTLAAGDGSNDLKMLGVAGLGVAWNAKPKTQEQAPMRLNGESLSELLCLLGPDPDGL